MPTLELRMLRKIPKKYLEDRPYADAELAGLEDLWAADGLNDAYHAKIRSVSRYASSEDIKTAIAAMRPDLDMSCWSYQLIAGGAVAAHIQGEKIVLDQAATAAIERDHEAVRTYENQEQAWSIEIPRDDVLWLEKCLPGYLDAKAITKLARARLAYARQNSLENLDERAAEQSSMPGLFPDIMGFLCGAVAVSGKRRLPVYACIIE